MPSAETPIALPADAASPELALVDPVFAIRARLVLPDPGDTLARLESEVALRRLATRYADDVLTDEHALGARRGRSLPVGRRSQLLRAATATTAALTITVLLGVNVNLDGTPADAGSTQEASVVAPSLPTPVAAAPTGAKASERATTTPQRPTPSSGAPSPRRFAWAPVAGATGYRVEFFRGDTRIYSAATAQPQLTLPSSWTFEGRKRSLTRGMHRWYVWPVVAGLRQSEATVQAELVVP